MRRYEHDCYPYSVGYCPECKRLRRMTREEFVEWFRVKHGKEYCPNQPRHLIPSYYHSTHCQRVSA